jgi:hypothetical protein
MRKLFIPVVFACGCLPFAWGGPAAPSSPATPTIVPLTSLKAISALSNAEADRKLPVNFQATVTYARNYNRELFVQEGSTGIFVEPTADSQLVPGDRIQIKGTTNSGYRPWVTSSAITVISHGAPSKPVPASWEELIRGRFDSMLVTAHGVVQSADLDAPSADHVPGTTLRVLLDGGYVDRSEGVVRERVYVQV